MIELKYVIRYMIRTVYLFVNQIFLLKHIMDEFILLRHVMIKRVLVLVVYWRVPLQKISFNVRKRT